MARRGLVLLIVWVAFLADLMVGAGLLLSSRQLLQTTGLAMVLGAALAMTGLTLWFYLQNRRANRPIHR